MCVRAGDDSSATGAPQGPGAAGDGGASQRTFQQAGRGHILNSTPFYVVRAIVLYRS